MRGDAGTNGSVRGGQNGWFHAVTEKYDEKHFKGSDHLLLHDCCFKIYPSCRHTHCGIDAGVALHKRVDASNIVALNVYIYPNAIKLAGIKVLKNQDETKFSIQYTLACALLNGSYGTADMDPSGLTEDVVNLIEKIHLISDENLEDRNREIRVTRMEVVMKDGSKGEETVLIPKGDLENPLTRKDSINKLKTSA